ncbi:MAG: hypothetical protein HKL90_10755 [Elusimicrobia bacterium]|nr:hypothetical protein [Elusimicrobiota bacterium]
MEGPEASSAPDENEARWNEKKMAALLDAGVDAIQRSRYVFIAITIAGILMLSAQFNAYLPWIREPVHMTSAEILKAATEKNPPVEGCGQGLSSGLNASQDCQKNLAATEAEFKDTQDHLRRELWEDLHIVDVPVLGLKFDVWDLQTIGSVAMAVLALWYFFAQRRENHVIGSIVDEAIKALDHKDAKKELPAYLYYGIAHHQVFSTATTKNLLNESKFMLKPLSAIRALTFMPFWVPLVVLSADALSIVLPHKQATLPNDWGSIAHMGGWQIVEILVRSIICLSMACYSRRLCREAGKFEDKTRTWFGGLAQRVDPDSAKRDHRLQELYNQEADRARNKKRNSGKA